MVQMIERAAYGLSAVYCDGHIHVRYMPNASGYQVKTLCPCPGTCRSNPETFVPLRVRRSFKRAAAKRGG